VLGRADERRGRALAFLALREQPLALRIELTVEAVDERDRLRRERVELAQN
jgi:hypothetical protein